MRIISERAKVIFVCPGSEGFDAEVVLKDGSEQIFIHANSFDRDFYTVAKVSMFDDERGV